MQHTHTDVICICDCICVCVCIRKLCNHESRQAHSLLAHLGMFVVR